MSTPLGPFEQIALAGQCVRAALALAGRPALWLPWLVLGVLQALALGAMAGFAHPWVSAVMAPLVAWLAGPDALHYPNVFRVLPALHAWAAFALDAVPGVIVIGAATALFAARFEHRSTPARVGFAAAGRRAVALVVAHLPLQLLVLAVTVGVQAWLHARGSGALVVRLAELGGIVATVALQGWFVFIAPLVMLEGLGAWGAWRELPHTLGRGGVAAFTLAVLAAAVTFPAQMLGRFADRVVERGTPELVAGLVAAQIAIALVAGFVLSGAVTLAYQSVAPDVEERS